MQIKKVNIELCLLTHADKESKDRVMFLTSVDKESKDRVMFAN